MTCFEIRSPSKACLQFKIFGQTRESCRHYPLSQSPGGDLKCFEFIDIIIYQIVKCLHFQKIKLLIKSRELQ